MYKIVVVLFLFPFLLFGQYEEEKRILETLCSSEFGGRGYVNSGDSLAAEFLAKEFEALGLTPVGGSYFQKFSFPINTFPGKVFLELNGKTLTPGSEFLIHPASGNIEASAKTKVFQIADFNNGNFTKHIPQIQSGELIPVFSPGESTNRDTLMGLKQAAESIAEFSPVILLSSHLSWYLSQKQLNNVVVEIHKDVFQEGEVKINVEAKLKQHTARNVMAEIPAKGKTKKTIVFTAHYDHLGRMGQDTYFPGANDNGSGTTMLLSLARELIKEKTNTRYIFIAFAGEEVAVLGSKYFVENPKLNLKKIDFLINLDILGGAQDNITVVNGTEFTAEFNRLVQLNDEKGYLPKVKSRGPTANSDHHWFFVNGVRCFYIYTAGNNKHYHVPEDHAVDVDMETFMQVRNLLLDFVKSF